MEIHDAQMRNTQEEEPESVCTKSRLTETLQRLPSQYYSVTWHRGTHCIFKQTLSTVNPIGLTRKDHQTSFGPVCANAMDGSARRSK